MDGPAGRRSGLLVLVVLASAPTVYAAKTPTYTVVVSAPHRAYHQLPVSVSLPRPLPPAPTDRLRVTDLRTKEAVPAQGLRLGDQVEVDWIVADLAQGESRRYAVTFGGPPTAVPGVVKLETQPNAVEVTIDGQLFTRYCFQGAPKPYCYPVIGPTGAPVTRSYPMEGVAGEPQDHPHQRSFWFTFGEVNGIDFWAEGPDKGRQVHREFQAVESGPVCGVLRAVNDWIGPEGKKVCEEARELRVYRVPAARLLDFTTTIRATEGPVEFGDTKEGMFGFRVAKSMQLAGGQGHILNSAGQKDTDTWGKAAEWCDYFGPVSGATVGIAILDHPQNVHHPTHWHVRDYGLFAANPFGLKYFINDQTGAGRYTIPQGGELTFRYRILIHQGTPEEAKVADVYAEYADPPEVELR